MISLINSQFRRSSRSQMQRAQQDSSVVSKLLDEGHKDAELVRTRLAALDMDPVLELQVFYDELINEFPLALGKAVSKRNREDLKLQVSSLVYGETEFRSLGNVIEKIKQVYGLPNVCYSGTNGVLQGSGGIFYDLGSGTGKPVLAAMILHEFSECIGIEFLEGLYSVSQELLGVYTDRILPKMESRDRVTQCQMINGDFLDMSVKDWRNADIVFANSTCYEDDLMKRIAKVAVGMKKGSFFVSLTRKLPVDDFVVLEYDMHRMSWGEATIFIMQKRSAPRNWTNEDDAKG